jgi:hypothetical protein
MNPSSNFFADPRLWIALASLVVSICSAIYSGLKASRALAISESQERRRQPQFGIHLANAYRQCTLKRQLFGFLVSVANPTDINNSVARAELQITCLVRDRTSVVCRIQHNPQLNNRKSRNADPSHAIFALPLRVDAHQTASGWFLFALDNDAIGAATIDAHSLLLEDTHGVTSVLTAPTLRESMDESEED